MSTDVDRAEYVRRVVENAPPLTPEQRDVIAAQMGGRISTAILVERAARKGRPDRAA